MEQRALVASALVLGCVTAAGAGGYLALNQPATPASQPTAQVAEAAARADEGVEGTVAEIAPESSNAAPQAETAAPVASPAPPPPPAEPRLNRPASQAAPVPNPSPVAAAPASAAPAARNTEPAPRTAPAVDSRPAARSTPAEPARAPEARPAPRGAQDADAGTANDNWPVRTPSADADTSSVPPRPAADADTSADQPLPSRTASTETSSTPAPARRLATVTIPADAVIGVQLETGVSSTNARVEDVVRAKVTRDLVAGGDVVVPAGTRLLGNVTLVDEGGRLRERARLGIRFHTLVMANGTEVRLPTETIYREGDSPVGKSAAKIGGAAVGGAILGAIMGGGKGAVIGAATGAGSGTGWAMAGDRHPAELRSGQALTVRVSDNVSTEVER